MQELIAGGKPTQVDYIAFIQPDRFQEVERIEPPAVLIALAVRFGSTRLIDNLLIRIPS
jgi:pantothenate synthetase